MQTVQLSDGELGRLINNKNVTKDGWTFGYGGLDTISEQWQQLRDGEKQYLYWTEKDVRAVAARHHGDDEDVDRAEIGANLFDAFLKADGEARHAVCEVLHDLDYNVDRRYVLEDTRGEIDDRY